MGEVIDLNEFRQRKLSKQFDTSPKKKKVNKQDLRERRENELDDDSMMNHPAYLFQKNKKKFKDDE